MKELKELKVSELKGAVGCFRRKKIDITSGNENLNYQKAAILKNAIREAFFNNNKSKIREIIFESLENLSFYTEAQKNEEFSELVRNSERIYDYLVSKKENILKLDKKSIEVLGYRLIVNPDYGFTGFTKEGKPFVELWKIKNKKPVLKKGGRTQETSISRNIEMLSLVTLAREYLPSKEGVCVAKIVYTRKKEEMEGDEKFFSVANQVVEIKDEAKNPDLMISTLNLERELGEFLAGTKCTKTMCSKCDYNAICNYIEAPVMVKEKAKEFNLNSFTLSPEQEQAVNIKSGTWRINAGAGCGKTLVVTLRVANLILSGVKPERILLTTFTNAGVDEMRNRINLILSAYGYEKDVADKISILTLNSFGMEIIRKYFKALKFSKEPTVIDDIEVIDIILKIVKNQDISGLDFKNLFMNQKNYKGAVYSLKEFFSEIKEKNLSKDAFIKKEGLSEEDTEKVFELYNEFEEKKRMANKVDYSDQTRLVFELLNANPFLFENSYDYEHVIVDEFQDCSEVQIELIKAVCSTSKWRSLMVVGDDSQAIYGFRDTSPKYLIHLENFLHTKIEDVKIMVNHRSTKKIVRLANFINDLNKERIEKSLVSLAEEGKTPTLEILKTTKEEISYISSEIKKQIEEGKMPEDICIIARTKSELLKIQDLLAKDGIPTQLLVPENAVENSKVNAVLELAEFLDNPENTKSLFIYLNAFYEGKLTEEFSEEVINKMISENKKDFEKLSEKMENPEKLMLLNNLMKALNNGTDDTYRQFYEMVAGKGFETFESTIKYLEKYKKYGASINITPEGGYKAVMLTTAHSSKGKEWDTCFVSISGFDPLQGLSFEEAEETRRLLFVAITRAKKKLYISSVQYIGSEDHPLHHYNRYLHELEEARKAGYIA